ncbi:ornithine decarboxylase [Nocardia sp. 2YAB30]|uniref:ornithine decarboxylase n=1 Tax=Nocardia sp. 2YAB30 TaxID=3233022 RepID=UPI003F9D1A0A
MPSERLRRFVGIRRDTPYAVFDVEAAERAYDRHLAAMDGLARVQFAVKARPEPELLAALSRRGAGLDVASAEEVRQACAAGCPPERLSYGNVFRTVEEIVYAYERGVRTFCVDSQPEIARLGRHAPGASVLLRLACVSEGALLPMSHRFGCAVEEAVGLAEYAAGIGLDVAGLAWHVGSQQCDLGQWSSAVANAAQVWTAVRGAGIRSLRILNAGGGLPAPYRTHELSLEDCAATISAAIARHFGRQLPEVIIEPGRSLVADAGVTVSAVKTVVERGERTYVILDAGVWNAGLVEAISCDIDYPVSSLDHDPAAPHRPVILCGPTCDPLDEIRAATPYDLPVDLGAGDRLMIGSTGAYCMTLAAVGFCGYPPLRQYTLPGQSSCDPVHAPVEDACR